MNQLRIHLERKLKELKTVIFILISSLILIALFVTTSKVEEPGGNLGKALYQVFPSAATFISISILIVLIIFIRVEGLIDIKIH